MEHIDQRAFKSHRILLGIVISLAILGHTRMFFHYWNMDPADLSHTTPFLFFTLFISHYFATAVYFIMGIGLYFKMSAKNKNQNVWYLLQTGGALVLIELILNNFSYTFDPYYRTVGIFIIGSLGLCMIYISVLQYFSRNIILLISLSIIIGHHFLDPIQMKGNSIGAILWYVLHQHKFIPFDQSVFVVKYTVLPWLGLVLLGYFLGYFYRSESSPVVRKKILLYSGWSSILLFFLLRGINSYGDPNPWHIETSLVNTIISFFNVTKYPASLDYITITLGPILLFLAYVENWKSKVTDFFFILGKFPFFTYLFSTFLIHSTAMFWLFVNGKSGKLMVLTPNFYGPQSPLVNYGYSLAVVYLLSGMFVLICYFISKKLSVSDFNLFKN